MSATDGIYTDHVAVSWTGSPNAMLYEVWVSTSNNSSTANRVSTGSALNYDDYAAVPGTTYYYWITAKNNAGTSGFSASDNGYRGIVNPVPAAPIGVSATDGIYTDHVAVSWTGSPNATLYEVWVSTSNNSSTASRLSTGSVLNYDDYSAVAGTTYYYWITAKNNTGTSGFSASDSGYRISNPVVPAAPTGVSATDGTYTDKVVVTWNASSGVQRYGLWRSVVNDSATSSEIVQTTLLSADDTAAVAGTTYYYWVKAQNTAGTSGFSAPDSGYRATVTPVPAAPIGVSATDGIYTDHVAVSWTASAGATLYEVWVSTSNNSSTANRVSTGSVLNYDDYSAVTGTTYYYWITAKNNSGTSGFSAPDSGYRAAAPSLPNLTPYQPAGWSDKIVVATASGQRSDAAVIYDDQDIFVSWAVINQSLNADASAPFYFELAIDGKTQMNWSISALSANSNASLPDYQLGRLSAGVHSIRLTVDTTQAIAESDENDNAYSKTISVRSRGTRNISLSGNLAFGNVTVGSFAQRTMTISNNGTLPLTVNSLTYPSGFSGNWSSGIIPAGASRDVVVTFRPVSKISYGGNVVVNSDASSGIGSITISGTGVTTNTVAAKDDFNGDGLPDIIFQSTDGSVGAWFMNGNENLLSASLFTPSKLGDLGWQIVGSGDFNGDGKTDLLFQHNDGSLAAWLMDGMTLASATALKPQHPGAGWLVVGTGDFNQDGRVDILFQHEDGTLAVWFMNGVNLAQGQHLKSNPVAGWSAVGTGDFNQDGKTDILLEYLDGTLGVWFMDGISFQRGAILNPPHPASEGWRVSSILDLNKDGKPDLVLQHEDGTLAVWFMDGTNLRAGHLLNPSNPGKGWQIVGPK